MWSDTQRIQTQLLSFLGIFAPFHMFSFMIITMHYLRILITFHRILALYSHVCMYVCVSVCVSSSVTFPFISTVWCFRPNKPYIFWKLIIWWWQWLRRILTKRQRHTYTDKDKYKVLPRPNVCYIYQKQGVQGFKILYWLSSCDDKDKDKDTILCIIRAEYFIDWGDKLTGGGKLTGGTSCMQ